MAAVDPILSQSKALALKADVLDERETPKLIKVYEKTAFDLNQGSLKKLRLDTNASCSK